MRVYLHADVESGESGGGDGRGQRTQRTRKAYEIVNETFDMDG